MRARILAALAVLGFPALACMGGAPAPVHYVVADDFDGWVIVEYGVADAAELRIDHGRRRVEVPPSGLVRTSSPQEFGTVALAFQRRDGTLVPQLEGAGDHASVRREAPFACCLHTGDRTESDGTRRTFEAVYVGRGPAGAAPDWPKPPRR